LARSKGSKIELTAYDDLFETDERRAEAALSKIRDIPISEIDEFPDHIRCPPLPKLAAIGALKSRYSMIP